MSFVKKTWKDRISQFPNRRTINDGYVTKQVTVGRDEGAVTEEGTPFDATEMNDLENRIYAAIEEGGGGGGSAGTYNYTELFNKPRINNHELDGNKSLGDLGIASNADELPIESGSATTTKDYIDSGLSGKADKTELVKFFDLTASSTTSDSGISPFSYYGQIAKTDSNIHNILSVSVIDTQFNNPAIAVLYGVSGNVYTFMVYSARSGNVKIRVAYN